MQRVSDLRLSSILEFRACSELPPDVVDRGYSTGRKLLAARSWGDVSVFARAEAIAEDEFIVPVHGKWVIVFRWSEEFGAFELRLKRLR